MDNLQDLESRARELDSQMRGPLEISTRIVIETQLASLNKRINNLIQGGSTAAVLSID